MAKIKDLSETYSAMQRVALLSMIGLVVTVVCSGILLFYIVTFFSQRVYVVGLGSTTQMALADSPENHTAYEMRNLVLTFATNMYAHDQYTYKTNLNRALPLIDNQGARRIYADFKRQDILGTYRKFGARTSITVDSINLDTSTLPVRGKLYMRQTGFLGDRQSKSQPLGCSFEITNTGRSDKNAFGMQLTRFDYFPYNPAMSPAELRRLQAQQERDAADLQAAKDGAASPTE